MANVQRTDDVKYLSLKKFTYNNCPLNAQES